MKYTEYQVFTRNAGDHDPNHWKPIGKPNRNLDLLREIFQPEDTPNGVAWRDGDKDFKVMQRAVTVSEWRTEDAGTSSWKRYA